MGSVNGPNPPVERGCAKARSPSLLRSASKCPQAIRRLMHVRFQRREGFFFRRSVALCPVVVKLRVERVVAASLKPQTQPRPCSCYP